MGDDPKSKRDLNCANFNLPNGEGEQHECLELVKEEKSEQFHILNELPATDTGPSTVLTWSCKAPEVLNHRSELET